MKYCNQCGAKMKDADKFCMNCGDAFTETEANAGLPVAGVAPPQPQSVPGVKRNLLIGALLAVLLAAGGLWGWHIYVAKDQMKTGLYIAARYLGEYNYEQAVAAFSDIIRMNPQEVRGYQGLARTYTLLGRYEEAWSIYEKGMTVVRTDQKPILQLGLASMYIDQNKYPEAEQAYKEIINTHSDKLEAYWGLSLAYQQQGNGSQAESILRQAIEKNPADYRGYNALATFLYQNGQLEEALNSIIQSISLEINQQEAYLVLNMFQGDWPKVRDAASKLSSRPLSSMLEFYSYFVEQDYDQAISTYQEKLSGRDRTDKAVILAATALVRSGDQASADSLIQQLRLHLRFTRSNDWLLSELAAYYLAAGDQEQDWQAYKYADRALKANGTNLEAAAVGQAVGFGGNSIQALLYSWQPVSALWGTANTVGNTAGNIVNTGIAAQQGGWIYYNNYKLYKIRTDGSSRTKLSYVPSWYINVVDEWVYYNELKFLKSDLPFWSRGTINKMRTDGRGRTKLNDDASAYVNVVGDWIYYTNVGDGGRIYKMRTDGSDRTKLNDMWSCDINVAGEWIYYTNSVLFNFWPGPIYKMRTDGSSRTKLNDDASEYINVADEWLYYNNGSDSGKLYKIGTDGSGRAKLNDDRSSYINVEGEWIYYQNGSDDYKLYKIRTDGSGKTKLNDDASAYINVAGDWIYYKNGSDDDKLYKIRPDGSGRGLVQ